MQQKSIQNKMLIVLREIVCDCVFKGGFIGVIILFHA